MEITQIIIIWNATIISPTPRHIAIYMCLLDTVSQIHIFFVDTDPGKNLHAEQKKWNCLHCTSPTLQNDDLFIPFLFGPDPVPHSFCRSGSETLFVNKLFCSYFLQHSYDDFSIQCLGTPFMIARRKSCRGRTKIRRHMLQSLGSIHRGRTRICRHKLWSLDSLHLSELTFLKLMPQEAKLTRGRRYLVLVLTSAGIFRPVFLPILVPIYKMWVIITAY